MLRDVSASFRVAFFHSKFGQTSTQRLPLQALAMLDFLLDCAPGAPCRPQLSNNDSLFLGICAIAPPALLAGGAIEQDSPPNPRRRGF